MEETISLAPSIVAGWNFDCQSHYWINHSIEVEWAQKWTDNKISQGARRKKRKGYYKETNMGKSVKEYEDNLKIAVKAKNKKITSTIIRIF
jgi:hypothetical protein